MSRIVDEHRQYLTDLPRVDAFRRAIAEVVRPGDVVLDLGSGTGILGLLACQMGAGRVYSVESTSLVGLSRQIASDNGVADRITFIRGFSTTIDLPGLVDVVLADQIGRFGFDAGVFQYFADARKRFLKPGGTTVPSRIELWAAAVESEELWTNADLWSAPMAGFDMRAARGIAMNTGYPVTLTSDQFVSEPVALASVDPTVPLGTWRMEGSMVASGAGVLHGVGGWFAAQLSPSVTMTNSPLDPDRIQRRNVFFPVERPVQLVEGDRVTVAMQILPSEILVSWKVQVHDGKNGDEKARFSHSTWKGMLISAEDLRRTRPDFVPKLTPRGEARQTVLDLCDGVTPLEVIQDEVFKRHESLFENQHKAELFVSEVVTRYSE